MTMVASARRRVNFHALADQIRQYLAQHGAVGDCDRSGATGRC